MAVDLAVPLPLRSAADRCWWQVYVNEGMGEEEGAVVADGDYRRHVLQRRQHERWEAGRRIAGRVR